MWRAAKEAPHDAEGNVCFRHWEYVLGYVNRETGQWFYPGEHYNVWRPDLERLSYATDEIAALMKDAEEVCFTPTMRSVTPFAGFIAYVETPLETEKRCVMVRHGEQMYPIQNEIVAELESALQQPLREAGPVFGYWEIATDGIRFSLRHQPKT